MKKFLTVLLVIAVMFTFSFGSAFAVTPATNADANLIKQAADYAKTQLPEAVQKAYTAVVSGGTANTYITTAAWDAAAADIVKALEDAIDSAAEAYLADTGTAAAGWNQYDYVYAAGKLFIGYDYATLATAFAADANASAVMAAKEQFKLDLADAMSVYDKVNLSALYSTTAPATGKTYYVQAAEKIAENKTILNEYFIAADGSVQNLSASVAAIAANANGLANAVENGITLGGKALTPVKGKVYEGTSIVEYYYVAGIPTITNLESQDAVDAATTAAIKAQVAKNVAAFLQADSSVAAKEFADNYATVYNFLAEQVPNNAKLASDVVAHASMMATVKAGHGAAFASAVSEVEALEAYAAKCAAEKDADGKLVRDAKDVADIVEAATLDRYAEAAVITDASIDTNAFNTAYATLAAMSIDLSADKLAFDKEAKKADLADALAAIEDAGTYYDLEFAAVKAAYEAAYAKIDAAAKTSEFAEIETALAKEVAKVKTAAQVDALFTSGKMQTELNKQTAALKAYLTYANSGIKTYADERIQYVEANLETMLRDYYIENNARTVAEMQALGNVVEVLAATLPTNADLAAAKKAADDAIKALPTAAATTSADLEAYKTALDLAKAYNKMVKTATGTAGTTAIPAAKISALQSAIQQDILLAYAKADKTDKAALKAIAAEVKAANQNVGSSKLFAAEFTDPTIAALANIRAEEKAAVAKAISAIPFTVTEADKATVEKARELYDAYVAEYTDYDIARGTATPDGYVADDFDFTTLLRAEASLGLNHDEDAAKIASVESLKLKASSKAGKGYIKVTWKVTGDTDAVEGYQLYKSTKAQKGYKKCVTTTKTSFKNTKNLKKGTRYFYKVRAFVTVDGVKYYSDWSNKANRIAK